MKAVIQDLIGFEPTGEFKEKKQIVLVHSGRNIVDYISALKNRYNGKYDKLPNYVISKDGETFQVLPPSTYSNYMSEYPNNETKIIISLENLGWLKKIPLDSSYINWIGDIYKHMVFERKWRGYYFWDPYTNKQIESLAMVINRLCEEFGIPKETIGHNVRVDGVESFNGIATKSNYSSIHTELNPSFDFETFKKLLKNG